MKAITQDIERAITCPKCNGIMRPAPPSRCCGEGRRTFTCKNKHFHTPDSKRPKWTEEEDESLRFLMATYPREKVFREFVKVTPYKRSRHAVAHRLDDLALRRQKNYPDHLSRVDLANGLGVLTALVVSWEKKGLRRCHESSDPVYIYYKKTELQRFFKLNPHFLQGKMISYEFSATLVGILTGEW